MWSPQRAGVDWMTGAGAEQCNVKDVAFLEAAHSLAGVGEALGSSDVDTFRVYFGGADAVVGTAVVRIAYNNSVPCS